MRTPRTLLILFGLLALIPAAYVGAQNSDDARAAYDRAREQLDREDFREAVELMREVHSNYPGSDYAARALYWEAFGLQRLGRKSGQRRALELLEMYRENYPRDTMSEEAERLRTRVLSELAQRGESGAAREVIERAEGDIDHETRMMALMAIQNMDSDRAKPLLRRIVENRDEGSAEMRAQAMFLLGQHFDAEAEELMLDALRNDPDREVREQALFWLGQSAGDRVIEVIEEILADPEMEDVYENAIFALSQSDSDRATTMLRELVLRKDLDDEVRANSIFWLGQRRGSMEFLIQLYDQLDDEELKGQVVFAASQTGSRESAEFLKRIFYDEDEDIEVRNNALFWLSQSAAFGVEELEGLYDDVDHKEMKEQVIFALSQQGGRPGVRALIDIARNETDLELRKSAIFWIGQSSTDEAMDFLEELLDQ